MKMLYGMIILILLFKNHLCCNYWVCRFVNKCEKQKTFQATIIICSHILYKYEVVIRLVCVTKLIEAIWKNDFISVCDFRSFNPGIDGWAALEQRWGRTRLPQEHVLEEIVYLTEVRTQTELKTSFNIKIEFSKPPKNTQSFQIKSLTSQCLFYGCCMREVVSCAYTLKATFHSFS